MSLESKIEMLIKALATNTEALELNTKAFMTVLESRATPPAPKAEKPQAAKVEQVDNPPAPKGEKVESAYTEKDVKEACLTLARTMPEGKEKAKSILLEYGANKVSDLKAKDLDAAMTKLQEALEWL